MNLADYNMELPVVVKTCCGGSSVGVYITKTPEEYEEALKGAFSYHYYENFYTLSYIDKMWGILREEAFPESIKL